MITICIFWGLLKKPDFERREGRGIFSARFGQTTSGCSVNGSLLRGKFHIQGAENVIYGRSENRKKKLAIFSGRKFSILAALRGDLIHIFNICMDTSLHLSLFWISMRLNRALHYTGSVHYSWDSQQTDFAINRLKKLCSPIQSQHGCNAQNCDTIQLNDVTNPALHYILIVLHYNYKCYTMHCSC